MPASMPALPVAASGAPIPSLASASSRASAGSLVGPSPTVVSPAGISDSAIAWIVVLNAMSGNIGQAKTLTSDRVSIGHGLPTVPKSLLEMILRWEFIDLAELVPSQSLHDQMIDTQARFALFELIRPKRKQIESITVWTKAYTVYVATLLRKSPEQASELLAYQLTIIKAAQQYDGLQWRAYDTHFRVAAAATGNRGWSKVDVDLFFTGRAKAVACCHVCDSTQHLAANCPVKKRELSSQSGSSVPKRRRSWASDLFNSSSVCSFRPRCRFRHVCGSHSAKTCSFLPKKPAESKGSRLQRASGQ